MSNVLIGIIGVILVVVATAMVIMIPIEQARCSLSIFAVLAGMALCRGMIRPPAGWAAA